MNLTSLKPRHLALYRDIARLLIRHGLVDLISVHKIDRGLVENARVEEQGDPEQLATDLEALGPTFVKLGQMLSTRADLLPKPYLDALSRLQDDIEPVPYEQIEEVVRSELKLEVDEIFSRFDREPLASASLGQVHRARLGDGREIAVKVQRPGTRKRVTDDLEAVLGIAKILDQHTDVGRRFAFSAMVEELRSTLLRELDYRNEAGNLERMAESLAGSKHICAPRPVERLCTTRVLTMDFVAGTKITELTALGRTDLDGREIAEELCSTYIEQMLLDGFFHADPHPGNVLLTPDGRLAMIDLGMVARLSPWFRKQLLKLMIGVADCDGEAVADICTTLGTRLEDYDRSRFRRRVHQLVAGFQDSSIGDAPLGPLVFALGRVSAECGVRPPAELAIVGKTMSHLDQVGAILDPKFEVNAVIRRRLTWIAGRHMLGSLSPRRAAAAAFELNEFVQELPRRINTVLDALNKRELEVRVHAFDEQRMMSSLHLIGSRITLGLVFSALIVGAALVMRIDAEPRIMGYPALAVLLFLSGAIGSMVLVAGIVLREFRNDGR